MNTYKVIVSPVGNTEPGNLQFISRMQDESYFDYIETNEDGNEIYKVFTTDGDYVEQQLNANPGVVSFERLS